MADNKGVCIIITLPLPRRFDAEVKLEILQLHVTVEKTIQYDDDDLGSGPSSDPNSPATIPMTPTNAQV